MKTVKSDSTNSTGLKKTGRAQKLTGWKEFFRRKANLKTGKSCGQQVIHYDRYKLTPVDIISGWAIGAASAGVASYTFYRSLPVFILMFPAVMAYPLYRRKSLRQKRLQELNLQFKEGILVLSSFLSAGYSIENALAASEKELELLYGEQGMINREFSYMAEQQQMNRPVEALMLEFGERSGLEDIENFARIFSAAKRSGGQLVPVINHTVIMIQDKLQVQEEIKTLTASKQFEQKVMNLIPFFIILYIDGTSPGFFDIMYETLMGRVLMTVCLAVYVFSCLLSRKILQIEM